MTEQELQTYIDNYTSDDFNRIELAWNGMYGQDFVDDNYDFRMQVCEMVVPQIAKVNIELVRDLYCETGKTSPMTFSVYTKFYLFADELLKRGGTKYLLDYIRGASHSMDTGISSGRLTISKQQAKVLLGYFDELKLKSTDPEEQKLLNDFIRQRLEYNANRDESADANSTLTKVRRTWWQCIFGSLAVVGVFYQLVSGPINDPPVRMFAGEKHQQRRHGVAKSHLSPGSKPLYIKLSKTGKQTIHT